jgi:2-polyprenyl-3-methyl-5-hydroxy-6-metoxy-1,4-benzoquinol methylase
MPSDENVAIPNRLRLCEIAKTMYSEGPIVLRKLQQWRPYICPYDKILGQVEDGSKVLDIGCGAGLAFGLLAGLGYKFQGTGFDVSQRAIEVARTMTQKAAIIAPQAQLSFERLEVDADWPQGTYDVVFLIDVMHHVPPSVQHIFFRRAISKVKDGGKLVYKDMCMRPSWRAQANRLHDLVIARELINYAPVQQVEAWAEAEGMRLIFREDINRLWYGHELRVLQKAVSSTDG